MTPEIETLKKLAEAATMYPCVNPMDFADTYAKHVQAMTAEGLHSKSAIAEQLAWRDVRIEALIAENEAQAARIKELEVMAVSEFDTDHPPTFRQGVPVHELEEAVTAERCTGLVGLITTLRAQLSALQGDGELPEPSYKQAHEDICGDEVGTPTPYWNEQAVRQAVAMSRAKMVPLTVVIRSYPESNGKRNWTALFVRKQPFDGLVGNGGGITIARGECWNRVAYEAERARILLGERISEPSILQYGKDIGTPDEWAGVDHEAAHGITGEPK